MYFTSWDANVFLCLLSVFPEEIVRGMIRLVKDTHEEFSLQEARGYWESNSPRLVKLPSENRKFERTYPRCRFRFRTDDRDQFTTLADYLTFSMVKFHQEWRMRSIEERQKKVINWCKFGEEEERLRHRGRLRFTNPSESYSNDYTNNLWRLWDTWGYCEHPPQIANWDTSRMVSDWDRRNYVSKWYEGIHPGRFFLFYKKNKILEERNRGVPSGPCEDGYRYPQIPIFDWGAYEQLIEDLRCLDGSGIGEPAGRKVEHIDDMFS